MAEETREGTGERADESRARALLVVGLVALACATLVSGTAVLLEPARAANRAAERDAAIRGLVASVPGLAELVSGAEGQVEARLVELATGRHEALEGEAAGSSAVGAEEEVAIPAELDLAGLRSRPSRAVVHLVRRGGRPALIILPISGRGYVSVMKGYLALEGDGGRVVALTIHEQRETPGLGARVADPDWRALWKGKTVFGPDGGVRLHVAAGRVDPKSPEAASAVDAITGATRTSQGVTQMLRYWLGEHGFGPFLDRLREEGGAS